MWRVAGDRVMAKRVKFHRYIKQQRRQSNSSLRATFCRHISADKVNDADEQRPKMLQSPLIPTEPFLHLNPPPRRYFSSRYILLPSPGAMTLFFFSLYCSERFKIPHPIPDILTLLPAAALLPRSRLQEGETESERVSEREFVVCGFRRT